MLKYNSIVETSPDGIMILNAIRDGQGNIIDFLISTCNRSATILGHLPPAVESKTMLTVLPHLKDSKQFLMHKQVIDTGEPIQFETTFRDENGIAYGWFIVSLMKLEDSVFSRFIDISAKKEYESKLEQQSKFYNSILEASINGLFVCEARRDLDGVIIDFIIIKVNKAFNKMSGKTSNEVEGQSYFSLFTQTDDTLFYLFCKAINTGIAIRLEFQYPANSGYWYDISIGKLNANSIVITFTDISEQKKSFIEVEQKNKLLTNILSHSPSGISVTKVIRDHSGNVVDGKTILANEVSSLFTGMPIDSFKQLSIKEIAPGITQSRLFKKSLQTLQTGRSFSLQVYNKLAGKWLEIGVSKMDNNHLVNIFSDVTAIKESQFKLENTVRELKRTNANLEEFTYAASHDLKEPIRKIRIFAERLTAIQGYDINSAGADLLDRLLTSSIRMQQLVDDLLEYSHLNDSASNNNKINLSEILQVVLNDLDIAIGEKKATIQYDNLPEIKGNKRQMQRLFQNLIGNSLKYCKPEIPPKVTISWQKVKQDNFYPYVEYSKKNKWFFHIKFEDNGVGFEQKDAAKIFRVFQRLHWPNELPGTGIGLSIVKRIVENHSGHISAFGQPGIGAVFNIYLPEG